MRRLDDPSNFRLPRTLEGLLALLVVLELTAPFVTSVYGMDSGFHLLWIQQFIGMLEHGVGVPKWIPSGFGGFGSATFYFYPPLTYYLAAGIHFLTGVINPRVLYELVVDVATLLSFVTVRALVRWLGASPYQATVGAILYAAAPLRLFEVYNRGDLSTHLAYAFLPLVAWSVAKILRIFDSTNGPRSGVASNPTSIATRIVLLAITMALLSLTNVPVMLAVAVVIGILTGVTCWKLRAAQPMAELMMAAVLTLLLTAFHFSSVLSGMPYARLNELIYEHSPRDILIWFQMGTGTYNLILVYVLGTFAAYLLFQKGAKLGNIEKMMACASVLVTGFAFFLDVSPLSFWIWRLPGFGVINLPWRFYPSMLLLIAIIVATARSTKMQLAARRIVWITTLAVLPPLSLILFGWHATPRFPREDTAYLPPSRIADSTVLSTISLLPDYPLESALKMPGMLQITRDVQGSDVVTAELPNAWRITFHRFYWPYWHLLAQGREIPSHPDSLGRAVATLPAGNYTATWKLERTPLETAGLWISVISWAGVLLFFGIGLVRKRVRIKVSPSL